MTARDRIVDAAITALRTAGVAGTSLGQVLTDSGAPKGSLYHYFPAGKEQVVLESLAVYGVRVRGFIDATLGSEDTPAGKVRALLGAVARRLESAQFNESCAAGTVSLDLRADDERIRASIAAEFDRWIDVIARHFPLDDPARGRSFASLLLTTIEGGYVRGRAARSAQALREAAEWLAPLAEVEVGAR